MGRASAPILIPVAFCAVFVVSWTAHPLAAQDPQPAKTAKSVKPSPKKETLAPESDDASRPAASEPKSKTAKVDMSAIPADEAAEKKVRKELGEAFKLKRTQHYSIFYNTSDEDMKTFSLAIEQTYRSCVNYTIKLGFDAHPPKKKLLIYYFEEHKQYSDHSKKLGKGEAPQSTPGIYFPDLNRSMFYNFQNQDTFKKARKEAEAKIEELKSRLKQGSLTAEERRRINHEIKNARSHANWSTTVGGDVSESIVQHEVSHQVLWNIGFHNPDSFFANPRWLAEGTAMMFEPISTGTSANFGALNADRLKEFQALQQAHQVIPLRDFISTHNWFGPQTIGQAYAEGWALVHYLNRVKRKQLKTYVETINQRPKDYETTPEQEIKDFEKVFGKVDRKWVDTWLAWMKKVH